MADRQEEILDGVNALSRNLLMPRSLPRRTLSLETLENRITPTLLGLTLPGPLGDLVGQVGLQLPAISLTLPSLGHSGLGLSVDAGILSLQTGVGGGGGLLSVGVAPPSGGVGIDPPAFPQGPGPGIVAVVPPTNVSVGTPPLPQQSIPPTLLTLPPPVAPRAAAIPLPVVAVPPAAPADKAEAVSVPEVSVFLPALAVGTVADSSSTLPRSAVVDVPTFESFLLPRRQEVADQSPRGGIADDDLAEELFGLRAGRLLEDFGTAIAADEAVVATAEANNEQAHDESDGATALWLVGVLAGFGAGAAWLNRRGEGAATPVDADPCLNPSG
jgi:hypothetical protein